MGANTQAQKSIIVPGRFERTWPVRHGAPALSLTCGLVIVLVGYLVSLASWHVPALEMGFFSTMATSVGVAQLSGRAMAVRAG
jgi:hypothetical protein